MRNAQHLWIAAIVAGSVLVGASTAQAQQYAKVLPADTEMAITFNLKQILGSEAAKANKEAAEAKLNDLLEDKGVAKYFKKANFNLLRDLSSVTMAMPRGRSPEEWFMVMQGHFDADKIEAAVTDAKKDTDAKVKIIKIGTSKAYEVANGDKFIYIGILNKKTMIASATKADFTKAVEQLSSNNAAAFKSETFKSLLETVNEKQSISFVATGGMLAKLLEKAPIPGNNQQANMVVGLLQQSSGFSAAITIEKHINLAIGVNTKDEKTAGNLALGANLGLVILKAKIAELAKQNADLAPAVEIADTLRVDAKGANIVVNAQVTVDNLEKLLKNLPIPQ